MADFGGWFEIGDAAAYTELAQQVPENGTIVEVGVCKGRSTQNLCEVCKGTNRKIIAIDTWMGSAHEMAEQRMYRDGTIYKIFLANMKECGYSNLIIPMRQDSLCCAKMFAELGAKFDLILLDSDHRQEFLYQEINLWLKCLKEGGTIGGHDFRPGEVGFTITRIFGKENIKTYKGGSVWSAQIPKNLDC